MIASHDLDILLSRYDCDPHGRRGAAVRVREANEFPTRLGVLQIGVVVAGQAVSRSGREVGGLVVRPGQKAGGDGASDNCGHRNKDDYARERIRQLVHTSVLADYLFDYTVQSGSVIPRGC
jgi:hypothetical protein